MDGVGKVDNGGAGRQVDNVALWGKDKALLRRDVRLDRAYDVLRVARVLLHFQQLADKGQALLQFILLLDARLVLPVSGDAVFGSVVHLPGSDLNLKGDTAALLIQNGGVQRLVHVGLRRGDVVLKALGDRGKFVVHDAEHRVALVRGIHDDPHGIDVINLVKVSALHVHLAVDAVDALDPALQKELHALFFQSGLDLFLDVFQKLLPLTLFELEQPLDFLIGNRVQKAQRDVLQFLLDGADTQAVSQRSIDLHRLQRLFPSLILLPVFASAHVVQPVGQFYDDDAHVLGHRQQHLAHVFRLALLLAGVGHLGQLGDAVHHQGYVRPKALFYLVQRGGGVLHHIVQQAGTDGLCVHSQLHQNLGDGNRVGDIGISGLPHLPFVRFGGILICLGDFVKIIGSVAFLQSSHQIFKRMHPIHQPSIV